MSQKLSILVVTKNRSEYVKRLIQYYVRTQFRGTLLIGDSSNQEHAIEIKKAVEANANYLNVRVFTYTEALFVGQVTQKLLEKVDTPYSVFLGDDDFLVTEALGEIVQFLDSNNGYVAANGGGILFGVDSSGPHGTMSGISSYKQLGIYGDTAASRLEEYFSNAFVALFSIHRTEVFKKMYACSPFMEDAQFADELSPGAISVVNGRIKHFDLLYLVRQGHKSQKKHDDIYDTLTSRKSFVQSYDIFRRNVVSEMMAVDGVSEEQANSILKKAFWFHLVRGMSLKWKTIYEPQKPRDYLVNIVRKFPVCKGLLNRLRIFYKKKKMNLPYVLNPGSPYSNSFENVRLVVEEKYDEEI